jgi:hypothetical protein
VGVVPEEAEQRAEQRGREREPRKSSRMIAVVPAASPSRPSVKLKALTLPTTTNARKGTSSHAMPSGPWPACTA